VRVLYALPDVLDVVGVLSGRVVRIPVLIGFHVEIGARDAPADHAGPRSHMAVQPRAAPIAGGVAAADFCGWRRRQAEDSVVTPVFEDAGLEIAN
jgi:hypothetical protein